MQRFLVRQRCHFHDLLNAKRWCVHHRRSKRVDQNYCHSDGTVMQSNVWQTHAQVKVALQNKRCLEKEFTFQQKP